MYTQIAIDLNKLPEKIRIYMSGDHTEVTCRKHFQMRFKKYNGEYAWGYTVITRVEQAPSDEQCFDCEHNP
jgi:hypothetical protein